MNCSQFTPCEGRTEIVDADGRLIWHNDDICMVFVVRDNAPVVLAGLSGYGMRPACELNNEKGAFPIVEVLTSISGRTMNHQRLTDTREGSQLRFVAAYTYERGMRHVNTLFGNPTADKELPLIEGAGKLGVDVFCIDAGWYDSADGGWWDMVGEWKPSTNRFGNLGLKGIASAIRKAGMGLGLWLEPEVVGVRSPIANELPDSAFFCRHGERVADDGRYHLDFRSPDARAHMDDTMERIIAEFQPKFFKFDYNTVPGVGTEIDAGYLGEGLLGHSRAYVRWLDDLKHRHPELVIENCGSGAMRADYAMLQRLDLQSTSDQCDPAIYAAIAAGASMSILPEQQGNWGYAQQEMDDETAVFTLAAGIAGRLYLSGFVNRMDERRLRLVRGAIEAHRQVLRNQSGQVPFWPLGLPVFSGDWLASGLLPYADNNETGYMTIWHRGGANSVVVEVPQGATLRPFFPKPGLIDKSHGAVDWHVEPLDGTHVRLTVSDNRRSARVYAIDMPDSTK